MIGRMPWWTWVWPLLAWCVLLAVSAAEMRGAVAVAGEAVVLVATVFAAVWHAEVVAHRVGEPFGTLVLALAVTVIEVALIVSVMLAGKAGSETLARDTAFAAVMLILNGLVGLSLLMGGVLHHEQEFQVKGASAALAVLAALVTLSLVLPNFTTSVVGPAFSPSQLAFAGTASLVLYGVFIFVQAVRHRDYFLPDPKTGTATDEEAHAAPPSAGVALAIPPARGKNKRGADGWELPYKGTTRPVDFSNPSHPSEHAGRHDDGDWTDVGFPEENRACCRDHVADR
jgi:Ca2+:H+ antiporter